MGESSGLGVRSCNLACPDQECGNQHQAGLTRFVNGKTRFQQLGLEFGWPHVNTTSSAFWAKKKKKLRLQAYICLRFQMVRGGGGMYKCQLSKMNGSHRKPNVGSETWLTESLLCIKCMCCSDRRISLLPVVTKSKCYLFKCLEIKMPRGKEQKSTRMWISGSWSSKYPFREGERQRVLVLAGSLVHMLCTCRANLSPGQCCRAASTSSWHGYLGQLPSCMGLQSWQGRTSASSDCLCGNAYLTWQALPSFV